MREDHDSESRTPISCPVCGQLAVWVSVSVVGEQHTFIYNHADDSTCTKDAPAEPAKLS